MTEYACYACHGLGFIQPIDQLARWLNLNTPNGIHFNTVGGSDPTLKGSEHSHEHRSRSESRQATHLHRPLQGRDAGLLPRLRGAARGRDRSDRLGQQYRLPGMDAHPAAAGACRAPANVGRWINFHQSGYPGGGVLANRERHGARPFLPDRSHMNTFRPIRGPCRSSTTPSCR